MKMKVVVVLLLCSLIMVNGVIATETSDDLEYVFMIQKSNELSTFLHMSDTTIKGIVYDVFSDDVKEVYHKNGWNFETKEYDIDERSGSYIIGMIFDKPYGFTIEQVFDYCVDNNMIQFEDDVDYLIDNYSTYRPLINDVDSLVFVDNYTLLEGPDNTILVSRNTVNKVNDEIGKDWTDYILIICGIILAILIVFALIRKLSRN